MADAPKPYAEVLIGMLEDPACVWTSELDAQCAIQIRGAITVHETEYGVFLARWIPWYAAPENRAETIALLRKKALGQGTLIDTAKP